MRALFICFLAFIGLPAPHASAQDEPTAGWMVDPAKACKVWTLSYQRSRSATVSWSGVCQNGLATGRGTAEFTDQYGDRTGRYDGLFQDGVFVGKVRVTTRLEPLPYDQMMAFLGEDPKTGAGIFMLRGFHRDASFRLCAPTRTNLYVVANRFLDIADDAAIRTQMKRAVEIYQFHCPSRANLEVRVVPEKFTMEANPRDKSYLAPMLASSNVYVNRKGDDFTLGNYRNDTAQKAADEKRTEESRAARETAKEREDLKREKSKEAFETFSRAWNVDVWATSRQIMENPFKFNGKIVGIRSRLERVLTPTLGRISSDAANSPVMLKEMPAGFYDQSRMAVIAVRIDGVGAYVLPDSFPHHRTDFVGVTFVGGDSCIDSTCHDYFYWSIGDSGFRWGEDQSAFMPHLKDVPPKDEKQL